MAYDTVVAVASPSPWLRKLRDSRGTPPEETLTPFKRKLRQVTADVVDLTAGDAKRTSTSDEYPTLSTSSKCQRRDALLLQQAEERERIAMLHAHCESISAAHYISGKKRCSIGTSGRDRGHSVTASAAAEPTPRQHIKCCGCSSMAGTNHCVKCGNMFCWRCVNPRGICFMCAGAFEDEQAQLDRGRICVWCNREITLDQICATCEVCAAGPLHMIHLRQHRRLSHG